MGELFDLVSSNRCCVLPRCLFPHASTEFLWNALDPDPDGQLFTVLDLDGISMMNIKGDVMDYIKASIALSGAHYPERAAKIFIINVPGWFSWLWAMVKPFLNEVSVGIMAFDMSLLCWWHCSTA